MLPSTFGQMIRTLAQERGVDMIDSRIDATPELPADGPCAGFRLSIAGAETKLCFPVCLFAQGQVCLEALALFGNEAFE